MTTKKFSPITTESEWTFDIIQDYYLHLERIATEKYGLTFYPNQIEIISSEQMLDAYSSVGLPVGYSHWSFGKDFVRQQEQYKRGRMGLAYEIVINSNPCISYCMEENTTMMQVLVIAHAAFGHNSFFKNNYLFKQWTDADAIIDYLVYAKKYIAECEEKYGYDEVESLLDSCHALQMYGVDKYTKRGSLSAAEEEHRQQERNAHTQASLNDIWRTVPVTNKPDEDEEAIERFPPEPEENVLYFLEKNTPNLPQWKREIIRIVRKLAQYFYPQMQTKVMNEGAATFFHYHLVHDLYDEGLLSEGFMMEFYDNHTAVVRQVPYDHPGYSGINPYALGFAMYQDIKRVAIEPTAEDVEWFGRQSWVGSGDWIGAIKWAMENFKDESFIQQFLSPTVIRDLKLFSFVDDDEDDMIEISAIHNKQGYKAVRETLAAQYNIGVSIPDLQVYDVDRWGDRSITLIHNMVDRRPLDFDDTIEVLKHLRSIWGFDVYVYSVVGPTLYQTITLDCDGPTIDTFIEGVTDW